MFPAQDKGAVVCAWGGSGEGVVGVGRGHFCYISGSCSLASVILD